MHSYLPTSKTKFQGQGALGKTTPPPLKPHPINRKGNKVKLASSVRKYTRLTLTSRPAGPKLTLRFLRLYLYLCVHPPRTLLPCDLTLIVHFLQKEVETQKYANSVSTN